MTRTPGDGMSKMVVHRNPIQRPGVDRLIRSVEYGGPGCGTDTRMHIDRATLQQFADVARQSVTGRAVLHGAGVRVDLYETETGHRYETWVIVGSHIEPEPNPIPGSFTVG